MVSILCATVWVLQIYLFDELEINAMKEEKEKT